MATPTNFAVNNYIKGVNGFGLPMTNLAFTTTLSASTAASVTVPGTSAIGAVNSSNTSRFVAVFSYMAGRNVYVSTITTAAVPAGGTLVASSSILNPSALLVKAGDVISIICATAATDVGIAFYALQEG